MMEWRDLQGGGRCTLMQYKYDRQNQWEERMAGGTPCRVKLRYVTCQAEPFFYFFLMFFGRAIRTARLKARRSNSD